MPQILISAGIVKVTPLYRVCTTLVFMSTINLLLTKALHLSQLKEKRNAQACITLKNLLQFHINSPDINSEKAVLLARDEALGNCLNLTEIIPQASVRYDVNDQRLDIDVPQAG